MPRVLRKLLKITDSERLQRCEVLLNIMYSPTMTYFNCGVNFVLYISNMNKDYEWIFSSINFFLELLKSIYE